MTIATFLTGIRTTIAISLVPASVAAGVLAALWAMDSFYYLTQIFVGGLLAAVLGVPTQVLALATVAAVVADAFQHANIAIRLGPLSWIFSIGDLHRWHHSRKRRESDTNYGNVYIFWDVVFGTRFLPKDREPPEQVGLGGMDAFPSKFFAQWLSPFRWAQIRRDSSSPTQSK